MRGARRLIVCVALASCGGDPIAPAPAPRLFADSDPAATIEIRTFKQDHVTTLPPGVDAKMLQTEKQPEPKHFLVWSFESGTWIGTNFGEWGGSLWFVPSSGGAPREVIHDNCIAIIRQGSDWMFASGLRHLIGGRGALHRLRIDDKGVLVRRRTIVLAGVPYDLTVSNGLTFGIGLGTRDRSDYLPDASRLSGESVRGYSMTLQAGILTTSFDD